MTYRVRPIKRERRTRAQVEQLDEQIIAALADDNPQSVRHVIYLMTNPRLPEPIEKSNRGYRCAQHRIVELRKSGRVPFRWITDAIRRGYFVDTYEDAGDFQRAVAGLFRSDLWFHSEYRCEVWIESRSIAAVVEPDCEELAVSLYPVGVFPGHSLACQAAESINQDDDGRPVVIFYIGGFDAAGELIDRDIESKLRQHLDLDVVLHFQCIAITEEQIGYYDQPSKPRKETDRRPPHITRTVEAEAMPAHLLREILRMNIEALHPPDALVVARAAEASERETLNMLARAPGGQNL